MSRPQSASDSPRSPSGLRSARISLPADALPTEGPFAARKQPRQARSRRMVEAILQAAAGLFAEQGYARTTTNKVAERAGVSVGSLYQYFPSKDALLACLLAVHHADVHAALASSAPAFADHTRPLEDAVRVLLSALLAVHAANPALTRALSLEVIGQSAAGEAVHADKTHGDAEQTLGRAILTRPDVRAGNPAAISAVMSQVTGHLTRWLVHEAAPRDQAALLDECVLLLSRYLSRS